MRKLKLSLDTLRVTTFETAASSGGRGTVVAHDPPRPTYGALEPSCDYTCPTSCDTLNTPMTPFCHTAITNICGGCNSAA
jgi:hypothetical protein